MSQNDYPWDQLGLSDDYFTSEQSSGEGGSNLFDIHHQRIPSSSQTDYTRASGASSPSVYEKASDTANEASGIPYRTQSCINESFARDFPERTSSMFQAPTVNLDGTNVQILDQQGSNFITSNPFHSYAQQVSFQSISPVARFSEDEEQTPKPSIFSGQYDGFTETGMTIPTPFQGIQVPLEPRFLQQPSERAGNIPNSRKRARLSTDEGLDCGHVIGNNTFSHPSPPNAFDTGITPLNEAMLSLCLSKLEGRSPTERELDGLQTWTNLPFRTITGWLRARGIPFDSPAAKAFKTAVPVRADRPRHDLRNTCQAKPISGLSWDKPRNAAKPYSCTNRCGMIFRKKGDWIRHEEITCPQYRWYCRRPGCPNFFRRDKYSDHLQNVHKEAKALVTSQLVDSARTPLLVEFLKKCGFCGRPCNSWKDWIDHVAGHFEGKISGGPWVMSRWKNPWADDGDAGPPSDGSDDNSGGDGGSGPGGSYNSADDSFGGSGAPPFYNGQDPDSSSGSGSGGGQHGQLDGPYYGGGMPGSYFNISQSSTGEPHHQPAPSNDASNEKSEGRSRSLPSAPRSASIIKKGRSDETQNPKGVNPRTQPLPKSHKSSKQPMKNFLHDDDPLGNFAYSQESQREDINARLSRKLQDIRQLFNEAQEKEKDDPEAKYRRTIEETVKAFQDSKSLKDSHRRDNSVDDMELRSVLGVNHGESGLDSDSDGHVADVEDAKQMRRRQSTNTRAGSASVDIDKHPRDASSSIRKDQSRGPMPRHQSRESSDTPVIGSGMSDEKHMPESEHGTQNAFRIAVMGGTLMSSPIDQLTPTGQAPANSSSYQLPYHRPKFFAIGRVFACLWTEPAGSAGSDHESLSHFPVKLGAHRNIRRLIIVRPYVSQGFCIPIKTYGSKGISKTPTHRSSHTIIYTGEKSTSKSGKLHDELGQNQLYMREELNSDPEYRYRGAIRLVDTPGIDDIVRTDTEILRDVSDYLAATNSINNRLASIVYLHRVSDNRSSNAAYRNLKKFQELCGKSSLSNIVLETWRDKLEGIVPDRQSEKEPMDKNDIWFDMNEGGGKIFRLDDGPRPTMTIVDHIISLKGGEAVMDIQRERVDQHLCLTQTAAGKEVARELIQQHRRKRTSPLIEEVSQVLQSVVRDYSKTFIVVDALDECQIKNGGRKQFLEELFSLQAKTATNFFVISRFIPEIEKDFDGISIKLEILASDEDLQRYLCGHILKLPSFVSRSADLQKEIKMAIIKAMDGMFLLAQLHLDSLIGKRSPKAIRSASEKLPKASEACDQANCEAMERIEGQVTDSEILAKQILLWITCAKRPLTTLELQQALTVEIHEPELDSENSLRSKIWSRCALHWLLLMKRATSSDCSTITSAHAKSLPP